MKEKKLEFSVASDIDFEDLVADIGYETELVALLTQEEGFENLRIRIYPPSNEEFWDFRFDEFEDIIFRAKTRLKQLQRKA